MQIIDSVIQQHTEENIGSQPPMAQIERTVSKESSTVGTCTSGAKIKQSDSDGLPDIVPTTNQPGNKNNRKNKVKVDLKFKYDAKRYEDNTIIPEDGAKEKKIERE